MKLGTFGTRNEAFPVLAVMADALTLGPRSRKGMQMLSTVSDEVLWSARRRKLAVAVTVLVMLGPGCGQASTPEARPEDGSPAASPTATHTPSAEPTEPTPTAEPLPADPPWGLDTITLPDGEASIKAVFEAFPDTVKGHNQLSADFTQTAFGVVYGAEAPSSIVAIAVADYTSQDPEPARTVRDFFNRFVSSEDPLVEELDADPSEGLLWRASRQAGGGSAREFVWGSPDSRWIFTVLSSSPAMRRALVQALVDVLRAS